MKYFSADLIFTNVQTALREKVIVTDDKGKILDLVNSAFVSADVQHIHGAIVPGFVNAHCHLELSHLKEKLPTGTGLIPFIRSVVTLRDFPQEVIIQAIKNADEEMYINGIVAVGDISNQIDTAKTKEDSLIHYYTFVEMFDFLQEEDAKTIFDQYMEVYNGQSNSGYNKKSCVPHAPYSVSPSLFSLINRQNGNYHTVSLHNQETSHENQFFIDKKGALLDFFKGFGISLSNFTPTGKPSIDYAMAYMNPKNKTLFVHNTMCDHRDIRLAHKWNKNSYWITCPNANLFIENRLPDYKTFVNEGAKMGVGTDSLSSNWQLSILEEIKTIQRYQSFLDTETLIKWSSYYSAQALSYDHLGSIEVGKTPGLVALEGIDHKNSLLKEVTAVNRLI
ncbi:MAG: amidohydrolase family protein [Saprospiraceae bacterium]